MGAASQRKGKKALRLQTAGSIHTGEEAFDVGHVRWEAKYGSSIVGPMFNAYIKAEAQSEAQRPYGDNRPFVFYGRDTGSRFAIISFRDDKIDEVLVALCKQRGLIE